MIPTSPGFPGRKPLVGIVGPGAVGRVLAHNLVEAGYPVPLIVGRRSEAAASLARELPSAASSDRLEDVPGPLDVVFCTVSDDALAGLTERLREQGTSWKGRYVAHTSGLRTSEVFDALSLLGAEVASFHPVQTFPPGGPVVPLRGICIGIEGSPRAVEMLRGLTARMGALPVELRRETKPLYHASAVVASNFFVTLIAIVQETLRAAGVHPEIGESFLEPLIESTWKNVCRSGPESALTGPIVRGDRGTVQAHLAAIDSNVPHLGPFYVALATETIRLAVRSGRLHPESAEVLLEDLHRWIADWTADRTSSA